MSGYRKWSSLTGLVGLGVIAVGGVLMWFWLRPATPRIDPNDAAQVTLGQAVYAIQCARCHGFNLEGQLNWQERQVSDRLPAPPHDESGHTWHHPDDALLDITRDGITAHAPPGYHSDMPAFRDSLTDGEIAAALAFIKSTWREPIRLRQSKLKE